jgi:hypothetical protein
MGRSIVALTLTPGASRRNGAQKGSLAWSNKSLAHHSKVQRIRERIALAAAVSASGAARSRSRGD